MMIYDNTYYIFSVNDSIYEKLKPLFKNKYLSYMECCSIHNICMQYTF